MVKLNLLDISEENVIMDKSEEVSATGKSGKEEREFSLETVDELFQSSQVSKQSDVKKTAPVGEAQKTPQESQPLSKTIGEPELIDVEAFDAPSRKPLLIVSLIVILILGALAAYYFLVMKGEDAAPAETAEPTSQRFAREGASEEQTPGIDPQIQALYVQNKSGNVHGLNLAQQLLGASQPDIQLALMVLTPGQIQFSVQTGSRAALNSYQENLRKNFPTSEIRLVNTEEMRIAGQNRILADFTFPLSQPGATAAVRDFEKTTPEAIQTAFRTLAQKHRINLQSFKKGQETRTDRVVQVKHYSILAGDQDRVMSFMQEVADTYPAILFTKIAFNPSDLGGAGRNQITARINFVLNEALLN